MKINFSQKDLKLETECLLCDQVQISIISLYTSV